MLIRKLKYKTIASIGGAILSLSSRLRNRPGSRGSGRTGPFGPPLECTRKLKELMALHYLSGRYADGAVPVAWVTSGFPVEPLRALGFHTVYPENHAALCSVKRLVPELSAPLERLGYSRDLCGYARADLGCAVTGTTPAGRLPRPDLLCCCTNICQTVLYWFRALADFHKAPLAVIDAPFVYGEAKPHHLDYFAGQLRNLTETAGKIAGPRATERAEMAETVRRSREGSLLWGECLCAGKARPSPWTGFDAFFHMAPIVALRGTEECNGYYRMLRDELNDRAARGVGGIGDERVRLLWDNLPVWFRLARISGMLAENGFNIACSTYTEAWAEAGALVDPADPEGSLARAYMNVLLNRDLPYRLSLVRRLCREYGASGAILHSDRSCKPYSIGQVDLKNRLVSEAGVRTLLLEADHADPRAWSEEQAVHRIQAFMESFS